MDMRFTNEEEVKKWLRRLSVLKKELELKISFYRELSDNLGDISVLYKKEYQTQINELSDRLLLLLSDIDRLWALFDDREKLVMTAKYIKGIRWNFIEYHTFYSRRQSIRIHNTAIKKLIGQTANI